MRIGWLGRSKLVGCALSARCTDYRIRPWPSYKRYQLRIADTPMLDVAVLDTGVENLTIVPLWSCVKLR